MMKIILLYIISASVLIPSLILRFSTIEPFHRGYFCHDTSIKYPYVEQQTIPPYLCFLIWMILCAIHFSVAYISRKSWKILLNALYKLILGFSMCMFITDVSKYSLGRLRPHFLTVCNPNLEDICYQLEEEDNEYYYYTDVLNLIYVKNDTCTGDKDLIREARLSFVSGHSSSSFYTAVFLIIFMKNYIKKWFLRILLQLAHFILAFWISITRINDYMHHPEDVIMGSIIGSVCAYIVMYREKLCEQELDKHKNIELTRENVEMILK